MPGRRETVTGTAPSYWYAQGSELPIQRAADSKSCRFKELSSWGSAVLVRPAESGRLDPGSWDWTPAVDISDEHTLLKEGAWVRQRKVPDGGLVSSLQSSWRACRSNIAMSYSIITLFFEKKAILDIEPQLSHQGSCHHDSRQSFGSTQICLQSSGIFLVACCGSLPSSQRLSSRSIQFDRSKWPNSAEDKLWKGSSNSPWMLILPSTVYRLHSRHHIHKADRFPERFGDK